MQTWNSPKMKNENMQSWKAELIVPKREKYPLKTNFALKF